MIRSALCRLRLAAATATVLMLAPPHLLDARLSHSELAPDTIRGGWEHVPTDGSPPLDSLVFRGNGTYSQGCTSLPAHLSVLMATGIGKQEDTIGSSTRVKVTISSSRRVS
jgi:hypothetical protein